MHWTVEVISTDNERQQFYLISFKKFQLLALQSEPRAFSSTLTRESAFSDSDWLSRLLNPAATTFVARQLGVDDDGNGRRQLLSSLTLFRLPAPETERNTTDESLPSSAENNAASSNEPQSTAQCHWEVVGVYTLPSARRLGIAEGVMSEAVRWARKTAASEGKECVVLTTEVFKTNTSAQLLWRKAGFVAGDGNEIGKKESGKVDGMTERDESETLRFDSPCRTRQAGFVCQ